MVAMHFNGIGARVGNPDTQLDPNAPSVIFVGGSFTMGHGLLHEETVVGQLESMPEFQLQPINTDPTQPN